MRVLLDHQVFMVQRFGGVSRYFAKLLENLDCTDTTAFRSRSVHLGGADANAPWSTAKELSSPFSELLRFSRRGAKGVARRVRKAARSGVALSAMLTISVRGVMISRTMV